MKNARVYFRCRKGASLVSIYARIIYRSEYATDFSIGIKCPVREFDASGQKLTGSSAHNNQVLARCRQEVESLAFDLESKKRKVTASLLRELYLAGHTRFTLAFVLDKYLEGNQKDWKEKKRLSEDTIQIKYRYRNLILDYLDSIAEPDLYASEFDKVAGMNLYSWLMAGKSGTRVKTPSKPRDNNYCVLIMWFLSGALEWASNEGYCDRTNYFNIHWQKDEKEPVPLTALELEAIVVAKATTRLARIRDFFLLQCYTGMSYAEMKQFRQAEHVIKHNASDYIIIQRKKSQRALPYTSYIPIFPEAAEIFNRYGFDLKEMVTSNKDINQELKVLADVAGVDRTVTSHIGRKTFADRMTERGYSDESVAMMMGHRNTNQLRSYRRVKVGRIDRERKVLEAQAGAA